MNNMYDILQKFNTVAASQILNEGRSVKEDDVEEGNRFTGELAKARAAGKKQADLDGDGDLEPVKEAKKTKPDFLDVDGDGDRKEPFKKAVADKKKSKKPVKESLRLIKETSLGDRVIQVYHDREYQEYHVCITEGDQVLSRQFAGSSREATDLVRNIISEARDSKVAWPGSPEYKEKFGQDRETFRKKFAPSVMRDPKSRQELTKLDTEYEAGKKRYGRDDEEGDDDEDGRKKDQPTGEKRGRGRPKKYTADRPRQERVTAKARKADRTAWTPDRKKKKVKEQDMNEQTTASAARVVADTISQAIQRDYAGQGFSWSGDQYDFAEFLDDQYADEAFVDDYHHLSDRDQARVMRAVAKAAREHFSGQDDVVDARGRGLMKGMREEQGTSEGSTSSNKRDLFPNYKGPRDEYGDPDDGSMYDPRPQKQREQDREKWDDRHHDDLRRGGMAEDYDRDEYDEEGEMAQSQARVIADAAQELERMLTADENLPEWVQKKIALAQEYIDSARDYLKSNRPEDDVEMTLPEAQGSFSQADYDKIARKKRHLMMLNRNLEPEDAEEMAAAKLGYDYDEVLAWVNADHDDVKEGSTGDYSAKKARAGRDIGKPGKQFAKIAKSAGQRYGSKERGEKVAGAVLAKLRAKESAGEELEEKAVSKAQRAAAGIARAAQKGEIPRSELRGASKEMAKMPAGELKKFAKTKEKGLPEKVKEVDTGEAGARKTSPASKDQQEKTFAKHRERAAKEKQDHEKEKPVKETTTAGSVATAPAQGEKKSKGGIQFGKGVYEAKLAEQFKREMQSIMTESLDVAITANADGSNTVTVTGKDVEPDVLQDLLQMAGMSGTREPVYQPLDSMPPGGADMAGMLDTLDGIAGGEPDDNIDVRSEPGDDADMVPEQAVCEVCGGHQGMHEAGCDREMALEADLANSADGTETMSTDYMVNGLSGGLNGPKQQVNPNNMADNPLAMKNLAKAPSGQINLGAIAEEIERETEDRLLALYRRIR